VVIWVVKRYNEVSIYKTNKVNKMILVVSVIAIGFLIKGLISYGKNRSIKKLKLKNLSINSSLSERELKSKRREIELELRQVERELSTIKVNHILHLILSIITAGVWLIIWLFITMDVNSKKNVVEQKITNANLSLISIEDALD